MRCRCDGHDIVMWCVLIVLMLKASKHDDQLDELRRGLDTVTVAPVRS